MHPLHQQIGFIKEIDKLKEIIRRSYLLSEARLENSAEHSWHIAVMAMFLAEHAEARIDRLRVLEMLLIHDLVEIDAGDTYCYDTAGNADKAHREQRAADRIFGLLPDDQAKRLMELWREFEEARTPESKFANALDRLMPLIHNYNTDGRAWIEHGVTKSQVLERNRKIADGSPALWRYAREMIEDAVARGMLVNA